jgi:O-glycosyl hydrolase
MGHYEEWYAAQDAKQDQYRKQRRAAIKQLFSDALACEDPDVGAEALMTALREWHQYHRHG